MRSVPRRLLLITIVLCSSAYLLGLRAQKPRSTPAVKKAPAAESRPNSQKIVVQGVEVEFTIAPLAANGAETSELMEEEDAIVRFRISDSASKTPWTGVKPAVWIARREGEVAEPKLCREKIQSFLQGTLRSRPDVDLNSYYLLALNQEPNISVIDPLLGFGGSKLITLILLLSPGEDWVINKDQSRLYVSMPAVNQVAIVDTKTWKVVSNVFTGAKPVRLALHSDEKYLWVGTDEGASSGVTVVDTTTLKVAARVATGPGPHEIAVSENNKYAYVTNNTAGTVTVIDVQKLAKVRDIKIGASSVAFSSLSNAAYVSDEASGQVTVIDGRTHQVRTRIAADPGIGRVRFAPGGRYGFAPNSAKSAVYIFDTATNRLLHTAPVGKAPDQIVFTREFAYVRQAGAVEVSMIRLSTVGKELDIVKFPGGKNAPGESRTPLGVADAIVPTPEGNSVLVANTADRQLYYYTEGMAAPMGNFQNYRRDPRAVLIADRSLREIKRGVYEAVTRIPRAGKYDVAFLLDSPRVTHCFDAVAAVNPTIKQRQELALKIEYLKSDQPLRPGIDYKLRFRLLDPATSKPKNDLTDVRVLTFLAPGVWQTRAFAKGVGDGIYELTIKVPEPGVYMIFVESKSLGVNFRDLPSLTLHGQQAPAPSVPASPE